MMDNPQNKRSGEALKGFQAQGVIERLGRGRNAKWNQTGN
jgi:hypothetical protein